MTKDTYDEDKLNNMDIDPFDDEDDDDRWDEDEYEPDWDEKTSYTRDDEDDE